MTINLDGLGRIVDNPLVKFSARLAMFATFGLASFIAGLITNLDTRTSALELGSGKITDRVEAIETSSAAVGSKIENIDGTLVSLRLDLAVVRGILEEMRRPRSASFVTTE